jgi:hypothetical protein
MRASHDRRSCRQRAAVCLLALGLTLGARVELGAAESYGQVTVAGVPVPGATITATQGDARVVTVSDSQGVYKLTDLGGGVWTVRVEMVGFATLSREITIPSDGPPPAWELTLLPFAEISRGLPPPASQPEQSAIPQGSAPPRTGTDTGAARTQAPASPQTLSPRGRAAGGSRPGRGAPASGSPTSGGQGGFQRAGVNASVAPPPATGSPFAGSAASDAADEDAGTGAADGFLINGSVNNGASSPFAQARAFGNARPGQRSLYNGGVAFFSNNSAWDSRPFSFTSDQAPKPSYNDVQFNGTFGGPLRIPRMMRNGGNVFVGYQRNRDHNATTQPALVPTPLEREGDFSQSAARARAAFGRAGQIVDPLTGHPFPGNVIPRDRISPQATALLGYYPRPSLSGAENGAGYNYQAPVVVASQQDGVQTRLSHNLNNRDQLVGTVAYNRSTTDAANLFAFTDSTRTANVDTSLNWSHRISQFVFVRTRYQFTHASTDVTPHFANRTNVSGLAGIAGNNQDAVNWGPPSLTFSSGIEGLSSAQFADNRNRTHGWTGEAFVNRGRHSFTFGGNLRRQNYDVRSQQNARGAFGFTGATTGSDLADFLLGLPQTSAIAFGNADKRLHQSTSEAYANDDWRVSASLTLNLGVRWEYESPITEALGRLVNLDVAPGFTAVSPVLAGDPVGTTTSQTFADSLVHPDKRGIQPRIGVAWRPAPGSSLVVRGGYGIYRNTGVYQSIALLMAQQPPLSTTSSVQSSAGRPLTLANGFVAAGASALNTFAVDPNVRVGYAENWQASVQRDLPASLTVIGTYLGSRGHRLMQEFLPNTYPTGSANPCPTCPSGFVYRCGDGSETASRHRGSTRSRRRPTTPRPLAPSALVDRPSRRTGSTSTPTTGRRTSTRGISSWRSRSTRQAPGSLGARSWTA